MRECEEREARQKTRMFLALGMLSIFLFLSPFPWWMMSDHPNREIDEFFKLHESWPSRELRIVVNLLDVSSGISLKMRCGLH